MTSLFSDIADAPETTDDELFGEAEIDHPDPEPPQRTSETRAKGRGTRTRQRECENCGETFVGGRKLCPDCKDTKPAAARTSNTSTRGNAKLENDLLESTISVASDISAIAPTMAGVLIARAEVAVSGMMQLAKGRPRVQAFLQKSASVSKIADLMSTVGMLIVAAMVDFGRISIDSPLLDNIGYADIVRDERGKAKRDPANGTIVKERRTLREIHEMMTGQTREGEKAGPPMPPQWEYQGATVPPGQHYTMPPMNWVPPEKGVA